jgi:hypothetical protein
MQFRLSRDRAFGAILGFGLGLLALSIIALALRYAAIYLVVFSFGLIIVAPLYFGVKKGLRFVELRGAPQISWPLLLMFAGLWWSVAIFLPFGMQYFRLSVLTPRAIPVFPYAEHDDTSIEWGDGENHGDRVHVFFVSESSSSEIVQFYRDQLNELGWEEGPEHFIESERDGTPYWFRKPGGGTLHIRFGLDDSGTTLEFEVIYGG